MGQNAEAKLQELRGKTNRQLVSLIGNKLDRGLGFARVLDDECSVGNAEAALHEAVVWMGLLHDASELDERRLEFKLAQLQGAIERARAAQVQVHAAS